MRAEENKGRMITFARWAGRPGVVPCNRRTQRQEANCPRGVGRVALTRPQSVGPRGQRPCSARTGAYCRARKRLPEAFLSGVACSVGRSLDAKAEPGWRWKGRRVYLFDGTTVTMPDTPASQAAYPQVHNQKPGLGS